MSEKNRELPFPDRAGSSMLRRTLFLMIVCGTAAFIVLILRLYMIQIRDHDTYESMALEQQTRGVTLSAQRGTIYDRNGEVLAVSTSVENLYLCPAVIRENGEDATLIARGLAEILDKDELVLLEKATASGAWYRTAATGLDRETADEVRRFLLENELSGVRLEPSTERCYPFADLASHVLGFVGTDNTGLSGVEYLYDEVLSGESGSISRLVNATGTNMLLRQYEECTDAVGGCNLELTLDMHIQSFLEKHVDQAVADYCVKNGAAAIAMDVNTGAILGMYSQGDFDPNRYLDVSDEVLARFSDAEDPLTAARQRLWRNKALSDSYEPGSTFKILTLAMALEEGVVNESSSFYCGGSTPVLGRDSPVKCWKTAGHGAETLAQAIQNSCNVAFVNIGLRVGAERFYAYARAFGLFDQTGVDLQGEGTSLWWADEVFCKTDNLSSLAVASFGQTFTITPLQLITAVSAVANGGELMQPYIVARVMSPEGEIMADTEPAVVRRVISESTSDTACALLESVVSVGTGKNAYVAGYSIAGKTGTSEKVGKAIGADGKEYIVSFIGFAPADDPQIAVLVLLDTPGSESGVYISGGQMAAPTVGGILADALAYLGVEKNLTEEEKAASELTVPDCLGLTVSQARAKLNEFGLTARVVGDGDTVLSQLPAGGVQVASGSELILETQSTETGTAVVPDLTDLTYAQAAETLASCSLFLHSPAWALAGRKSVCVTAQTVAAGETVPMGTVIGVTLSDKTELGRY